MKKSKKVIVVIVLLSVLLAGCGTNAQIKEGEETEGEIIQIGIVQPVEHPSLNEIREYIIIGLEEQGLKDKVKITYKDAQGDPSNINTIVSQFIGDGMDIIIPIGTKSAQSAAAATKDIPIVFAAVSYPSDAGLVNNLNTPEGNVTGVSDAIDVGLIFDLAAELTPSVETFGFIYDSGEDNSITAIEKAREYCSENGIDYVEATITNSSELLQASQSLLSKADAIFTPTDNTVASAMPVLASEAKKAKKPVYTGADSLVADGGFATVGIDYKLLGRQVAAMVKSVIEGKSISEIPVETLKEYATIINSATANSIGIELSKEQLETFQIME